MTPHISVKLACFSLLSLSALLQTNTSAQSLAPSDVVANLYHAPDNRADAFLAVIDDPLTGQTFDTYSDGGVGNLSTNHFAGLIFADAVIFDSVTITLVEEFAEGDGFASIPNVYLLTTQTDPGSTDPSTTDSGYILVGSLTGYTPDTNGMSGTGTFVFDFTTLPLSSRAGFGFAFGGVPAGGPENFINVGTLSAIGTPVPEPSTVTLCGLIAAGLASMRRRRN